MLTTNDVRISASWYSVQLDHLSNLYPNHRLKRGAPLTTHYSDHSNGDYAQANWFWVVSEIGETTLFFIASWTGTKLAWGSRLWHLAMQPSSPQAEFPRQIIARCNLYGQIRQATAFFVFRRYSMKSSRDSDNRIIRSRCHTTWTQCVTPLGEMTCTLALGCTQSLSFASQCSWLAGDFVGLILSWGRPSNLLSAILACLSEVFVNSSKLACRSSWLIASASSQ